MASGLFSPDVLQIDQVSRIIEHKYKASGKSLFEPLLQPFWDWSALFVPKSIAPNVLTFVGLLANVFSVALLLFHSSTFREELPVSSILLFAIGAFVYQTLDALDGMHARRTNMCSPLGELFDHGCDAISMYLLALGYMATIGLGNHSTSLFIEFFLLNCVFYTSQWQAFVTGAMSFSSFSVTEALVFLFLFSFISATFGVNFWQLKDPIIGLRLNQVQFFIVLVGCIVLFAQVLHTVSKRGVGKCGTTVANTSVLSPICPLLMVISCAAIVAVRSPTLVYQTHPCLYLLCFGAVMAKISQNLVIAHMTKSSLPLFDSVMLGPLCLLINSYFDSPLNEYLLLWLAWLWSTFDMLYFCVRVCIQVSDYLGIYIFRIGQPPQKPSATASQSRSVNRYSDGVSVPRSTVSVPTLRSRVRKQ